LVVLLVSLVAYFSFYKDEFFLCYWMSAYIVHLNSQYDLTVHNWNAISDTCIIICCLCLWQLDCHWAKAPILSLYTVAENKQQLINRICINSNAHAISICTLVRYKWYAHSSLAREVFVTLMQFYLLHVSVVHPWGNMYSSC